MPDPERQHASPYVAFSNNPVSRVDPDGRSDGPKFVKGDCKCSRITESGERITEVSNRDEYYELVHIQYEHFDNPGLARAFDQLQDMFELEMFGADVGPNDPFAPQAAVIEDYGLINPSGKLKLGASIFDKSFKSFRSLKRYLGGAGKGHAWHHIVEQTKGNIAKFGAQTIHSIKNIVRLEHGNITKIHNQISAFYSSKRRFTGGKTVREWLSNQSFKEQYDFGVDILERVYNGTPLPK